GAEILQARARQTHHYPEPPTNPIASGYHDWIGHKVGYNMAYPPLADDGHPEDLWPELLQVRLHPEVSDQATEKVAAWIKKLPKPVVLFHQKGNTNQATKSIPDNVALSFYHEMLRRFDGSIVLLDWDNRVPTLGNYRVRHLKELGGCSTIELLALMAQSDLIVGVDSGPLHASRFVDTPAVGLWNGGHYPARYALPSPKTVHVVPREHWKSHHRHKRLLWNLIEQPGQNFN